MLSRFNSLEGWDFETFMVLEQRLSEIDDFDLELNKDFTNQPVSYYLNFQSNETHTDQCMFQALQVIQIKDILQQQDNEENKEPFIKDPCLSLCAFFETNEEVQEILENGGKYLKRQPYMYGIMKNAKRLDLFELQIYARRKVLIVSVTENQMEFHNQDIHERRRDFNGSNVRHNNLVNPRVGVYQSMLDTFMHHFNFHSKDKGLTGFGTKNSDGSYSGAVGEVLKNEADFSKYSFFLWPSDNKHL